MLRYSLLPEVLFFLSLCEHLLEKHEKEEDVALSAGKERNQIQLDLSVDTVDAS